MNNINDYDDSVRVRLSNGVDWAYEWDSRTECDLASGFKKAFIQLGKDRWENKINYAHSNYGLELHIKDPLKSRWLPVNNNNFQFYVGKDGGLTNMESIYFPNRTECLHQTSMHALLLRCKRLSAYARQISSLCRWASNDSRKKLMLVEQEK